MFLIFLIIKQRWDSIAFDVMKYYVKRCVVLPGDTFEIKNARYKVRGKDTYLGNVKAQETLIDLVKRGKAEEQGICNEGVSEGALLYLKDHTRGKDERIFEYKDGKQRFW